MRFPTIPKPIAAAAMGVVSGFTFTIGGTVAKEILKRTGFQVDEKNEKTQPPVTDNEEIEL